MQGLKLTYITSNDHKFKDAQLILEGYPLERMKLDLSEIQALKSEEIVKTKLEAAVKMIPDAQERVLLIEDVSLVFENCNGLPGPLIKWFLDSLGVEGVYKFAQTFGATQAKASLTVGVKIPAREMMFFTGEAEGTVVPPKGTLSFGYSPIFMPKGHTRTYGEMTDEERIKINHRGMALKKVREYLESTLAWKPTV